MPNVLREQDDESVDETRCRRHQVGKVHTGSVSLPWDRSRKWSVTFPQKIID